MQDYYQCLSEAGEERRGGVSNGFYVSKLRVHLHMDEDCK